MPKLIITRGLPASGKTTRAKAWVGDDPEHRARINRDDLRAMVHQSVFVPQSDGRPGTERAITTARDAAITALLKRGLDIVNDDTNLPSRVARDLRRLAQLTGADFEVWDLTDVAYEECLRRNATREGRARVPDERMLDMYQRYVKGKGYPLTLADEPEDTAAAEPYEPDPLQTRAIMVDLDGTVALMGTRHPFDESLVHEDRPNVPVIETVKAYALAGYRIIFCSGRTDACREATEEWINRHIGIGYAALFMRKAGDFRKDAVVKLEIFDREIRHRYNIVTVLDDRDQVVKAWRSIGLTVLQVAPGDF